MTQYALERIILGNAEVDQAWRELKTLLDERIDAGLDGRLSAKSVSEILDEELAKSGRG